MDCTELLEGKIASLCDQALLQEENKMGGYKGHGYLTYHLSMGRHVPPSRRKKS